ncbi:MAG: hypothetical protein ACLQFR_18815 [Streptosporangiaceae bacterium]
MAADYAALEARVADLEQQMRHMLPGKVDAISYGVSVMHAEMREQFGSQGERLDRIELRLGEHGERLDSIDQRLDSHGQMLTEILRRLPGGASNVPSGEPNDH